MAAVIHSYHYLRGIDGQLPGDPAKTINATRTKKLAWPGSVAVEATEGLNQSDYLRRLAREMKEAMCAGTRGRLGIRAIGLLGSDIYDKLMILGRSVLSFPTLFSLPITTTRILSAATIGRTRTISSSPRLLAARCRKFIAERHVAPFRDTNQTSMYVGTLVATGRMEKKWRIIFRGNRAFSRSAGTARMI